MSLSGSAYTVKLSKRAMKDRDKLSGAGLLSKTKKLLDIVAGNPYQNPPPYEKLCGDFAQFYSRRINIQHRLVYTVHEVERIVAVRSMWSHYE